MINNTEGFQSGWEAGGRKRGLDRPVDDRQRRLRERRPGPLVRHRLPERHLRSERVHHNASAASSSRSATARSCPTTSSGRTAGVPRLGQRRYPHQLVARRRSRQPPRSNADGSRYQPEPLGRARSHRRQLCPWQHGRGCPVSSDSSEKFAVGFLQDWTGVPSMPPPTTASRQLLLVCDSEQRPLRLERHKVPGGLQRHPGRRVGLYVTAAQRDARSRPPAPGQGQRRPRRRPPRVVRTARLASPVSTLGLGCRSLRPAPTIGRARSDAQSDTHPPHGGRAGHGPIAARRRHPRSGSGRDRAFGASPAPPAASPGPSGSAPAPGPFRGCGCGGARRGGRRPAGIYRESVTIDKPLTVRGDGAEIRGSDVCPTGPPGAGGARLRPRLHGRRICWTRGAPGRSRSSSTASLSSRSPGTAPGRSRWSPTGGCCWATTRGRLVEATLRERWLTVQAPDVTIENIAMRPHRRRSTGRSRFCRAGTGWRSAASGCPTPTAR